MLGVHEKVQKLAQLRQKIAQLQEEEKQLRKELAEAMPTPKITVDLGDLRVAVTKIERVRVKDPKKLPANFRMEVKQVRVDLKKVKAHIAELGDLVEVTEDINVRITKRE